MVLPVDDVTIFSKGGVVLWSRAVAKLKGDPLNALIQRCLGVGLVSVFFFLNEDTDAHRGTQDRVAGGEGRCDAERDD